MYPYIFFPWPSAYSSSLTILLVSIFEVFTDEFSTRLFPLSWGVSLCENCDFTPKATAAIATNTAIPITIF